MGTVDLDEGHQIALSHLFHCAPHLSGRFQELLYEIGGVYTSESFVQLVCMLLRLVTSCMYLLVVVLLIQQKLNAPRLGLLFHGQNAIDIVKQCYQRPSPQRIGMALGLGWTVNWQQLGSPQNCFQRSPEWLCIWFVHQSAVSPKSAIP